MVEFSGSFRVRDALARGVGAGALRSQDLSAPFHGVRSVTPPRDALALCHAYATKMRSDAAFCGLSAARLWGMPLPASVHDDLVHVSTPHGGPRPTGRGVRGFQHDPGGVEIVDLRSLRVFSPIHTWLSLGRVLALPDLVAAADFILSALRVESAGARHSRGTPRGCVPKPHPQSSASSAGGVARASGPAIPARVPLPGALRLCRCP